MKKTILAHILIFILFSFFSVIFLTFPAEAVYRIQVEIPRALPEGSTPSLIQYINGLYVFGLSIMGVIALGVLVYGGIMYMFSGTITSKDEAKKWIWSALAGLVLGFANPDLVNFRMPNL